MARKPNKQVKRALAAVSKLQPGIRDAFIAAIQSSRSNININNLIDALDAGDISRATAMFELDQSLLFPIDDAIRRAHTTGGSMVASELPKVLSGVFGFSGRHPRAEKWVTDRAATLIQGIASDTLITARDVIRQGLVEGRSSRKIAIDLVGRKVAGKRQGGFIGLTEQQTGSIMKSREAMRSGDADGMKRYLKLKQRDRRFDATIRRAINGGTPVNVTDVDRITQAHTSKALKYRGRVIAKNETHSALAAGRDEGYAQVNERDDVDTVTNRWQHNLSVNPRHDHKGMDGTVIATGETFGFSDGVRMRHPHDPAGGAKHSIGCRCVSVYRVKLKKD